MTSFFFRDQDIEDLAVREAFREIQSYLNNLSEEVNAIIISASGVTSFNSRTGAVSPEQADYDSFFLTEAEADALFLTEAEADALYSALGHTHVEADITDLGAYLEHIVEDLSPQLGGTLDANGNPIAMGDQDLRRPVIEDYAIESTSPSISSGAITFDCENGNSFEVTLGENITSITLSNPPASGNYGEVIIKFTQDGTGGRTVGGWPASVLWPGGTAPTITSAANSVDQVALKTYDGGTTWFGDFSQDYQ